MATKNLYHRRLVAESSAKACWICYKPTPTVLTTPDNDDFFYICPGHLLDSKFAIAKDADDLAKKKKDEEIEEEIEKLKKEFQDKMEKKLDRRRQREHEKDGKKTKEEKKDDADEDKELEKEQEEKLKALESKKEPGKAKVEGPRIFELQKHFYQMRLQRKRDVQAAKRNLERLRNPNAFPSVPKDL